MYCPRCGKAEQLPETYCRQCGLYLLDLSKPVNTEFPPEDHLKANAVLSALTIITSFTLSILLWAFFGSRSNTHPLIFVTAGFLIAIGAWHIQTFIRTQKLKKQWKRGVPLTEGRAASQGTEPAFTAVSTGKLLDEADFASTVPASVTETTTRQLIERPPPHSS